MNPDSATKILLSCEHAVHTIPACWSELFATPDAHALLETHRGWDAGAAQLTLQMSAALKAPCVLGDASRLLIDLNRSLGNPSIWSIFTRNISESSKRQIIRSHYEPFRRHCRELIESMQCEAKTQPVLHLSIHSFTPVLDAVVRDADIGILYDPKRTGESVWALRWERTLRRLAPHWSIKHNYPYLGTDDGHTTFLRSQFGDDRYVGLELEVNQSLLLSDLDGWHQARRVLVRSLCECLGKTN